MNSAATAPRDLAQAFAHLNASALHDAAQLTGETVAAVALRRIRASMDRGHAISGDVWRGLPLDLRALLLTMQCPELDDCQWHARQPWASFTEEQRGRIGAFARYLRGQLEGARWLTR